MKDQLKSRILQLFARYPNELFRNNEIARRLSLKTRADEERVRKAIAELETEKKIKREKRGQFGHLSQIILLTGTLEITRAGHGFLLPDDIEQKEDILIRQRDLNGATHGDRVEIRIIVRGTKSLERSAKPVGEVVRILNRGKSQIVGTLNKERGEFVLIPDDLRLFKQIWIQRGKTLGATVGEKVLVEIAEYGDEFNLPEGRVINVLGKAGEYPTEFKAVMVEYGLSTEFPEKVDREVALLAEAPPVSEPPRRRDLRSLLTFTIDPEDAKDFDDALSVTRRPNGNYEVGVHIADVSWYVSEGSFLDEEARRRGTSVYLPGMVIPMLPHALSSNACSLRPGEDRLTYSVIMEMNSEARVLSYKIAETVIRSGFRLTYENVEEYLDSGKQKSLGTHFTPDLADALTTLWKLSAKLTKERMQNGSIDFETAEVRFRFDAEGAPVEILKKVRLKSMRLIEEFMLLANKIVARHVGVAKKEEPAKPFIFRIHDSPDHERIKELAMFVRQFGYTMNLDSGVTSKELRKLLDAVKGSKEENVINEVALRAMAKAVYSEKNIGHYGLGFDYYAHFTSPIRRYPDLIVHRLLKRYADQDENPSLDELAAISKHSSERERMAMEAERAAVKILQIEFLRRHVGDQFEAVISGVTKYGVFVELIETLAEGMIHVRDMHDDYYMYDEKQYALVGRESGRRLRLGDVVQVKVARVRPEDREIDFLLVSEEKREKRRKR